MQEFWQLLQTLIHYSLHLLLPGLIAWIFFKKKWKVAWLIMIATMIVDLDHLFSNPIFDPHRCSIGFHPLHSSYAIIIYLLMLFIPNIYVRIVASGLIIHMLTDLLDCLWIIF